MERNFVDNVVCFLQRKANKKLVQRNSKKKMYNIKIEKTTLDFYPSLKKTLYNYDKGNVLFFDDRIQFLMNPKGLMTPPLDWEVIFMNGNITKLGNNEHTKDTHYTCANVSNSTCVIINHSVKNKIKKFKSDTFEQQLNELKCYSLKNSFAVDHDKAVGLDEIVTPDSLDSAKVHLEGHQLHLKNLSNELPFVSLITPITSLTPKMRKLFFFTVMNFYKLDYPKDRLEWIIADDTPEDETDQITDLLPGKEDNRIKVIKCSVKTGRNQRLSLGKKLNICCNYANFNMIVHFFEWNYYPSNSIQNRVQCLLSYSNSYSDSSNSDSNSDSYSDSLNKLCVGTTNVGVYNFVKDTSYTVEEKDKLGHPIILYEPSLCYYKAFWEFRPFHEWLLNDTVKNICVIPWTDERYNLLLDIPYEFTCTKIDASELEIEKSEFNLCDNWDTKLLESFNICKVDYIAQRN